MLIPDRVFAAVIGAKPNCLLRVSEMPGGGGWKRIPGSAPMPVWV